jgi:peptide/nickel transport system substrate-binding protein
MKRTHGMLATAVAAASMLTIAACAPSAPTANSTTSGGGATLNIATQADIVNYNPMVGNSRTDDWVNDLMYPRLLTINSDGVKSPQLATKWGYTDPTHGYYDIVTGMKWSDGVPLTAKDVAYTFNATKKDKPAGTLIGQMSNFESATAVSATKIEITLSKPDSTVIPEVGFWANIVPEHIFAKVGNVGTFANNKGWVSAGPYRLVSAVRGQSYTMDLVKPYPLVPGGVPGPKQVVFKVYPDVNSEILALRQGAVDIIAEALPPTQVKVLQNTSGITVEKIPGLGYDHLVYNMARKPLDQLAVRKALSETVDYQTILNSVLLGQATPTNGNPIMPALKAFYEPLTPYKYDPADAKKILLAAGYKEDSSGNFPKLTFNLIYSLQNAVQSEWVGIIQKEAAKAGITIKLQGLQRNSWLADANNGDFDIYVGNFAVMDDPTTNMSLTYLLGGIINYSHVNDPKLSALIEQASQTTDVSKQTSLVQQAARMVHDNVYDNVMYTQNLYIAHRSLWSGFVVEPSELLSIVNPVSLASAKESAK